MKKTIFYITFLTLVISCSKDDDDQKQLSSKEPEIPESIIYDLNEDSVNDFTISYDLGVWDGVGASGFLYYGRLKAMGENRFLDEYEENVSTTFLFAEKGDSIQQEASAPQSWDYNFASLTTLWQGGDGVWSSEWVIESKKASKPYYVGIQIRVVDRFLIGWLKLEIDKNTGQINIIDHELTSEDSLVIDR